MRMLMHIAFDNSFRLKNKIYYFEYKGVRFKLIQNNPRKWSDVLLTIVSIDDKKEKQKAYSTAGEFLSALSWTNSSSVAFRIAGGQSIPHNYTLQQSKCSFFVFPQIPFEGNMTGHNLSTIPDIENELQRKALILFREARSSNKVWLSFLFYWQIMEIGGGNPIQWVNNTYYKKRNIYINQEELRQLSLGNRRIGEYFQDDCRHAIAHLRRHKGKTGLLFDVSDENLRMIVSARVVKKFAEHYIHEVLGMKNKLYLVRNRRTDYPIYVKTEELRSKRYVLAYP
jgi:hypothetical protein